MIHEERRQAELYLDLMGHDINNKNQVGIGYLEMALGRLKLSDEDRQYLIKPLCRVPYSSIGQRFL
jgi:hypothetical protein